MWPTCWPPEHFNPRSREGSDPRGTSTGGPWPDFNPRSREGSDPWLGGYRPNNQISIHAPVKGATELGWDVKAGVGISIHAPVKGATRSDCRSVGLSSISIHAPVKGATF